MKCQLKDMKVRRGKCKCVILQTLPLYYKLTLCSSDDPGHIFHTLTDLQVTRKNFAILSPMSTKCLPKGLIESKTFLMKYFQDGVL